MSDHGTALREVAALVAAALRNSPPSLEAEIYPVAFRLGLGPDATPEAAEKALREALREALGLKACRCVISGGELLPAACAVHGIPCEVCGGRESCMDDCGEVAR